jgi:DNA-binding SARP family transcriptional activator
LGPVAVERADGTMIHGGGWSRTKVRGLLAILALERGLPVHRERLTEVLWPSLDYRSARQNLNSTVYDLRQSLAMAEAGDDSDSPVLYESNQYSLRWSSCDWLDVVEFERLVHQARQASSPYQKVFQFRQALNLYREEFLSDVILVFANDYYLREQRRIQGLYLDTLEELGILEEGLGRNESAHELFARVLALDPCREQTSRRLMNLFLKAGERTAAVALFQELAKTLRSELGTVPDHETYQLFDAALNGH